MKFLQELKLKEAVLFFGACLLTNLLISFSIYYFYQFNLFKNEAIKISEYAIKTISEKNIEIKIKKDNLELNAESYLLENKDFPIQFNSKNLIFISKNADYADFTSKETLAILNSKELIIKTEGDYQNIPLESLVGTREEIVINKNTVQEFVNSLDLKGAGFLNTLLGAMGIQKLLLYIGEFLWGYFILTTAVFYLLKFSGYSIEKELVRSLAIAYYGVFLLIEIPVTFFKLPLNFIHVFVLGFFSIGFFLKFSLDKKLKQTL